MNIKRGIEYYYNGPEVETLKASYKEMKRAAERMRDGEHVMYINSLTSAREVEAVADSVSKRYKNKVLTYTVTSTTLAARLNFISLTCAAKKVRAIVLNSIDFAVRTTNQKKALVHWLREMRDVHDCRVIVFGIHAPTDEGAIGQLKYVTERAVRYSQWSKKPEQRQPGMITDEDVELRLHPSEAAEGFIADLEEELPVESLQDEGQSVESLPVEEVDFVDDPSVVIEQRHVDLSAMPPLKINDLAGAYALRAIKNYELGITNGGRVGEVEYA